MKKLFSILMLSVISLGCSMAYGQRAGEYNLSASNENWSKSGMYAEVGLGASLGDIKEDLAFSVGVGYRYHFGHGISWNILKVAFYNPRVTEAFEDACSMRFLTGIRYVSSPLLGDKPLYGNFDLGYQLNVYDTDRWKGFAYEFGVGVMLNPTVQLGIMWEGNVASYVDRWDDRINNNFGIFGAKLGINF